MIDTTNSFIAAYVVATMVYVVYIASLWRRAKRVKEKLDRAAERR